MAFFITLAVILAAGLIFISINLFNFFHIVRALLHYFGDQMPDADTMTAWMKWSMKSPIKKPFLIVPPGGPEKPPHADNYRGAR